MQLASPQMSELRIMNGKIYICTNSISSAIILGERVSGGVTGNHRGAELSIVTAAGKKLFLNLLVRQRRDL